MAEAAFLERVGRVGLQVGIGTLEDVLGREADLTRFVTTVEYMKPSQPLYIGLVVDRMKVDLDSPGSGDMITDIKDLQVGWFIEDGLRVGAGYSYELEDIDITAPSVIDRKTEYNRFSINGKMVRKLGGGKALNAEAMVSYDLYDDEVNDGSNTVLYLSGDYYFNNRMSAGVGLEYNRGDEEDVEGETLEANFTNFFTPSLYISVDLEKFEADNSTGTDEERFDVLLAYRF